MSNVKKVLITGDLPFDWVMGGPEAGDSGISRDEAASLVAMFLTPSMGLKLEYGRGYLAEDENRHGGHTYMYEFTISGTEAVSWDRLRELVALLRRVGHVELAEASDLDSGESLWEDL